MQSYGEVRKENTSIYFGKFWNVTDYVYIWYFAYLYSATNALQPALAYIRRVQCTLYTLFNLSRNLEIV